MQRWSFTPQSGIIKCKDFFNDLVGKYYNTSGAIYGFNTTSIKVNEEGVWFLLTNVKSEWFEKNLNGLVFPELAKAFDKPELDVIKQDATSYIVRFSRTIFSSTYYVSLLSYLLRVCSMEMEHKDLASVFTLAKETIKDPTGNIVKWGFKLPTSACEYWFYGGPTMNSKTHPDIAKTYISVLHNNGIMGWASQYKEQV
jgi:hypothetical protein